MLDMVLFSMDNKLQYKLQFICKDNIQHNNHFKLKEFNQLEKDQIPSKLKFQNTQFCKIKLNTEMEFQLVNQSDNMTMIQALPHNIQKFDLDL